VLVPPTPPPPAPHFVPVRQSPPILVSRLSTKKLVPPLPRDCFLDVPDVVITTPDPFSPTLANVSVSTAIFSKRGKPDSSPFSCPSSHIGLPVAQPPMFSILLPQDQSSLTPLYSAAASLQIHSVSTRRFLVLFFPPALFQSTVDLVASALSQTPFVLPWPRPCL